MPRKKKPSKLSLQGLVRALGRGKVSLMMLLVFAMGVGGGFVWVARETPFGSMRPVQDGDRSIEVRFSPQGGCADLLVEAIEGAEESIYVAAYEFSLASVTEALLAAHARGVAIYILVDKGYYDKGMPYLAPLRGLEGVEIYVYAKHAYTHDKNLIIDLRHVTTGSFNFSERAERKNFENLMYIKDDRALAMKLYEHWCSGDEGKRMPVEVYDRDMRARRREALNLNKDES